MKTKEEQLKRIKEYSLWMLGNRDYSVHELTTKIFNLIEKKDYTINETEVEEIIQKLIKLEYLDDERLAKMIIKTSSIYSNGPLKIRNKLREKKIDLKFMEEFEDDEIDWFELCKEYYQRKFKTPPVDHKEKSKRYRHLASRGYLSDHIAYAINPS